MDHEYLTEVLMWLIHTAGGEAAFALLIGAVTWAGFGLIYMRADGGSQPYVIVALGLALGAMAGGPIWGPRAQMITFFLTCLELLWIERYLAGRSRAINFMPLLMVLWANLHGGWVFGLGLLGVALVSVLAVWIIDREAERGAQVRRLALIIAASTLAAVVTPNGLEGVIYPFATVGSSAQESLIVEWFSPDFHNNYLKPFEVMLAALMIGMILRRPTLYHLLLTLTVTALALQSVRNIALFVATTTPILIWHWSTAWQRLRNSPRLWLARLGSRRATVPSRPLAILTIVILLAVGMASAVHIRTELGGQASATRETFPIEAADFLAHHPEIGHRMYNQYGWGGYLLNRFYPDPNRRVFIFGEAALMGDRLLRAYQDVQTLRPNWKQVLDDCQVDYVVYNHGEALDNVLRSHPEEWTLVWSDPVADILVRPPPPVTASSCP